MLVETDRIEAGTWEQILETEEEDGLSKAEDGLLKAEDGLLKPEDGLSKAQDSLLRTRGATGRVTEALQQNRTDHLDRMEARLIRMEAAMKQLSSTNLSTPMTCKTPVMS